MQSKGKKRFFVKLSSLWFLGRNFRKRNDSVAIGHPEQHVRKVSHRGSKQQ